MPGLAGQCPSLCHSRGGCVEPCQVRSTLPRDPAYLYCHIRLWAGRPAGRPGSVVPAV